MSENAYKFNIMNSIPCEFCETLIDLQDYEEHTRDCRRQSDPFLNLYNLLPNLIDRMTENLLQRVEEDTNLTEEGSVEGVESVDNASSESNVEENMVQIQPFDINEQSYEFFSNTQNEEENSAQNNIEETSISNSIFMEIPNSVNSAIPNNIPDNTQTFISNSLPFFINTNSINNQEEDNPLTSFQEILQAHLGDQTAENYNEYMNLAQQIGTVKIGLKEEIIQDKFSVIEKKDLCCICTEEKHKFLVSPCNHELCEECTMTWYKDNKKCAHCQVEIE